MLSGLLFLWKPVSLADCADAGKLIGAVDTGGGRIRRQLVLLAWVLSYMFASACHMHSFSSAVCVFISNHKMIKNNHPQSDI